MNHAEDEDDLVLFDDVVHHAVVTDAETME